MRWPGTGAGEDSPLALAALRALGCGVILESAQQMVSAERPKSRDVLAAAIEYMEGHGAEPVKMDALADQMGMSRTNFYALFKQASGMTPHDYLQRLRINKAQALLLHSRRTATDIAYSLGFSSSQYFSNVFRKYAGTTPTNFRRRKDGAGAGNPPAA